MQQLSRKSMDMLYISCRFFHRDSKKIKFEFFWSFYNFLRIFQVPAKHIHYLRNWFAMKSLEVLIPYRCTLGLWVGPQKDLRSCNAVLGWRPTAVRWNSGELASAHGRRRMGKGSLYSPRARFRGSAGSGKGPARGARWRPAAVAAASCASVRRMLGLGNVQHE
jgi:hypothetical protein